jgi:hypothetical protein
MIAVIEQLALLAANGVFLAAMYLVPYMIWASIDNKTREAIAFKKSSEPVYAIGRIAFFILIACLMVLSMYGLCHVVITTP